MGYRTSGRWIITGSADDVRAAWVAARLEVAPFTPVDNIISDVASFDDFTVYFIGDRGYIRFQFDDWKWYTSYSDVSFYERVWNYLSEVEGLSGKRVHIGEDNDIDELYFGDSYVELAASVMFYDDEPQPPTESKE